MNILLIDGRSEKDLLESTRLFRWVKKQLPNANVHVITDPSLVYLLKGNRYVDHIYNTNSSKHELAAQLNLHRIDKVWDLQKDEWSETLIHGLQTSRVEKKEGFFDRLFSIFKKKQPVYLEEAASLGLSPDDLGIDFKADDSFSVGAHDIPTSHHAGYLLVMLDSDLAQKPDELKQFCREFQFPVILAGLPAFNSLADSIVIPNDTIIYNSIGKFSTPEVVHLIKMARAVATGNNAWATITAALGQKMVLISPAKTADDPSHWYDSFQLSRHKTKPFITHTAFLKDGNVAALTNDVNRLL